MKSRNILRVGAPALMAFTILVTACSGPYTTTRVKSSSGSGDAAAVSADMASLTFASLKFAAGESASGVKSTFTVPVTGTNGTNITWTSSNGAAVSIDPTTGVATVTRPAAGSSDAGITLTATITRNGATDRKEFPITVMAMVGPVVTRQLTVIAGSGGTITTPTGSTTVISGAATTITAVPNSGYCFVNWTTTDPDVTFDDATRASTKVTLASADATVTANFVIGDLTSVNIGTLKSVASGTFNNGTSDVTVSSFYMSRYEITQAQYAAVIGTSPVTSSTYGKGDDYPVYRASWYDALVFCNKLSIKEGVTPVYTISGSTDPSVWGTVPTRSDNAAWNAATMNAGANGYRLPTEAEWEFAARGGKSSHGYTYSGSSTLEDVAWLMTNSGSMAHIVGTKVANELGLCDMSGNVFEWCWDWYGDYASGSQSNPQGPNSGVTRVVRGGGWNYDDTRCTVSCRKDKANPGQRSDSLGFRVVAPCPE